MFSKILIANRGAIAIRIILTCRELGIKTVAVYSEADENSVHVRLADENIRIGPARSSDSYLNVPAIITAAEIAGADAIHPGYGFLSESAYFAALCKACGISFIGPDAHVIELFGNRKGAGAAIGHAGLPIVPGSLDTLAGGGGMRRIEFEVIGDHHGNVVHLGERECSIQHLDQKLLDESPSPSFTDEARRQMGRMVVAAAKAVGYTNVGTFKFLMDADGRFSYLGTSTGLQVDHSVTEMVTGIDIVKEQIRAAVGERLSMKQEDVSLCGNAISCRINAEDPHTLLPSPGLIDAFYVVGGPGVRVDSQAHDGCTISPHYDSLVATITVHGRDRREAIMRMRRTLEMTVIQGIETSLPLHLRILNEPDFQAGRVTTSFMDRFIVNASVCGLAKTA